MDYQKSINGRSDYIGGIDNEALDFGQLDQLMHVATVGSIDETTNNGNINNNNNNSSSNSNNNNSDISLICDPKTESPATPPNLIHGTHIPAGIATVSARVSLSSAPIATPLPIGALTAVTSHLPESPPDSSSEPPYSPPQDIHGLGLTARELYNGLPSMHHQQHQQQQQQHHQQQQQHLLPDLHELQQQQQHHLQATQFTPPRQPQHQHQQQQHNPHHFAHNSQNHLGSAAHEQLQSTVPGVRVKHETGLIINPVVLQAASTAQQQQQQHHHHQMPENELTMLQHQQLMYAPTHTNDSLMQHFGGSVAAAGTSSGGPVLSSLYPTLSYPDVTMLANVEQTASCMLSTTISESARVQVIGTTQASHTQLTRTSAPSTPVHLGSSRKRKLSTQLDCPDFASIKPDPGLLMSPMCGGTPQHTHTPLSIDSQKLDPTSPVSVSMTPLSRDVSSTPAHSCVSLSPALSTVNSNADTSIDGGCGGGGDGGASGAPSSSSNGNESAGDGADANALAPCIRFSPFQTQNWHKLCDQSLQDIAVVYYRVDADKGFNFSVSDDAFVCQKKNHFQITCHARLQGDAKFVKTPSGLEKIKSFHLHFYGVKLETPNQTIRVEQSQSDRSKKPFYPVPIDLQSHIVSKVTVGRLHFSETTNNNMRKKGRPNPEQRYFQLVVGLHVHTMSGNFPVISQGSERIIVRASNPGQFESDVDLCWQRGITQDSIFHAGRVGINTDRPDESLVVHGNLKISGHIVQPSDSRAKQEISELDTSVQLRNLQKIRIVRYRYEPEFAIHSGLKRASESDSEEIVDTGVIAQEVREVIPDAVQEAGSIVLPNGNVIENFLLVNKDRILMENIGAVKELCKVTGSLETRIEQLERVNNNLVRAKKCEKKCRFPTLMSKNKTLQDGYEMCSNRALQIIIFLLIIVMAACLAAVSTLYFVEHNRQHHNRQQLDRLQVYSNAGLYLSVPHESTLANEEQHLMHLRNMLLANRTHPHWPNFFLPQARNNSKSRTELTYNEHGDTYAAHGRNDELTAVMEKPVVSVQPLQSLREAYRITTTAPLLRNNKTISSKNKSKWSHLAHSLLATHNAVVNGTGSGTGTAMQTELLEHGSSNYVPTAPEYQPLQQPLQQTLQPPQRATHAAAESAANASESSSEKVADTIPLPQDFENNSIDIDAQHITKKPSAAAIVKSIAAHLIESALNDASHTGLLAAAEDADVAPKLSEHLLEPITSTASSNSIISIHDTTSTSSSARNSNNRLSNADPSIPIPYRTVSPLSEHQPPDVPVAISNKSQGVLESGLDSPTPDSANLQSLSVNNNDSDNAYRAFFHSSGGGARESTLERRSTSQRSVEWVTRKTLSVDVMGAPLECTPQAAQAAVPPNASPLSTNCQSFCIENIHQLPTLQRASESLNAQPTHDKDLNEQPRQNVDPDDVSGEDGDADDELDESHVANYALPAIILAGGSTNSTRPVTGNNLGKNSHATFARTKHFSAEQQHADETDILEPEPEQPASDEHLDADVTKLSGEKGEPLIPRPSAPNCWKISTTLMAEGLNNNFGLEEFCPNIGKSLNLTYIVPLSKFFKESMVELHLSSSTSLYWTICGSHENLKQTGIPLTDSSNLAQLSPQHPQQTGEPQQKDAQQPQQQQQQHFTVNQLQRRGKTSILFLNLPSRGYFIRDVVLRATNDLEKENICDELLETGTHDRNTLLQYNFRVLRDCD